MKRPALVRYVPLFGSPGWMPEADARRRLAREDRLYLALRALGMSLTAPRIESARDQRAVGRTR